VTKFDLLGSDSTSFDKSAMFESHSEIVDEDATDDFEVGKIENKSFSDLSDKFLALINLPYLKTSS